jgi:hypothetical protein
LNQNVTVDLIREEIISSCKSLDGFQTKLVLSKEPRQTSGKPSSAIIECSAPMSLRTEIFSAVVSQSAAASAGSTNSETALHSVQKTDATVMRLCIVNPAKQAEIFGRKHWENIVSRSANFVRQQIQLFNVKENF